MLEERDTGERGQPVYQLVLERRVAGLCCGYLSLPVVPVAAAHGCGAVLSRWDAVIRRGGLLRPYYVAGPDGLGRVRPARPTPG